MFGLRNLAAFGVSPDDQHRGVNMSRFLPAAIAGAFMAAVGATGANAVIYNVPFGTAIGSAEVVTPVGIGDGLQINASIQNQSGPYDNKITFTAGAGVTTLTSAAAWFGVAPFGNSLTYDLRDSSNTLLATDVGPNFSGATGTITGSLAFSGLTPGNKYTLDVHGNIFAGKTGNYDLKVGFTPIPSAVLLLGSALVGVGYFGYRRRA